MKPKLINAHEKRALGSAELMSLSNCFEVNFLSCVPGFLPCLRLLFLVWLRMLTALQAFLWHFSAMLWAWSNPMAYPSAAFATLSPLEGPHLL